MAVIEFGSGALAALIAVLVTIVVLALIVTRIAKRDVRVRVARIGVFVERQRLAELPPLDEPAVDEPPDEIDTHEWPRPPAP